MATAGVKRKHIALTIQQMIEILKKLESGATARYLAKMFGINIRTVNIKKNKEKLLNFYVSSDSNAGIVKQKMLHKPKSANLDTVVYKWFRQWHNNGIPITGPLLCEKVNQIHKDFKVEEPCDFSTGCLTRI